MSSFVTVLVVYLVSVLYVDSLTISRIGEQAVLNQELHLADGSANDEWIFNGENSLEPLFLNAPKDPKLILRVEAAKTMQKNMDMLADPCEDFYQYACGNWEKNHPIPDDHYEYNIFSLLQANLHTALKELLEEAPTAILDEYNQPSAEDKAKYFYSSCVNNEARSRLGEKPLINFLKEHGNWPALDSDWKDENFDWMDLAAKLSRYAPNNLIRTSSDGDLKESGKNIIYIDEPTLSLIRRDVYLNQINSTYMDIYRELIINITMLLGASEESAEDTADEIVAFERELAAIKTGIQDRMELEDLYNKMNVSQLIAEYPNIDWMKYIQTIYEINITDATEVVLLSREYMKQLPNLLAKTKHKTIANYILWRYVKELSEDLDNRFEKVHAKFTKFMTGQEDDLPKWKRCLQYTNRMMGMAVGAMFVRRHFDESSKADVIQLTRELQQSFRDALRENSWIDEATRSKAEEKANKIMLAVGYPDDILDPKKLNKLYDGLKIIPDNYFENSINLALFETKRITQSISKPVNKEEWAGYPAVINAYFEQSNNRIIIPAGVLQPPIYNKNFPKALNYGGIGIFVGHELTHGFDDTGRNFDMRGDMKQWWTEESISAFKEHSECFINQYNNYSMHGKGINGAISKGENIADNGGVRQAYQAYDKWLKLNSDELDNESLPGLNITGKKLFFLGFAQVWCGTIRPEAIDNKLETDAHSPGKYRVLGTLSNFDEFAKEFNCPIGSGMSPERKCKLW